MSAPVWERIAAHLTSHLHMAVFILILLVAYIRPSELLAFKTKDLVPPLVPLFPCWSVVIAASKNGVSTKTGVRDGSVFMDQHQLQQVDKLLTMCQTRHSGANIDRVRGFRTLQEVQRRGQWKAFIVVRYDKTVVWKPTATLSVARSETSRKHSSDVPRYC